MAQALDSVLNSLKTGDLVLFRRARLARWLPEWLGGRHVRHVALVVRDPDHGEPMIWETAPAGAATVGVRLRRLAKRLETHPGRISVRRLNRPLTPAQLDRFAAWRRELEGRQIRHSLIDLMGAGEDGWVGAEEENLDTPLPGELVAEAYQRLGLLDGGRSGGMPARHYTPRWFEAEELRLRLDYALGAEIPLEDAGRESGSEELTAQPA